MFASLVVFGSQFFKELAKHDNPIRLSMKMIAKYFVYLALCILPASIIVGLIGSENTFVYLGILLVWSAIVILGLVIFLKKNNDLYWLLLFPVLPSIVFWVMRLELRRGTIPYPSV